MLTGFSLDGYGMHEFLAFLEELVSQYWRGCCWVGEKGRLRSRKLICFFKSWIRRLMPLIFGLIYLICCERNVVFSVWRNA